MHLMLVAVAAMVWSASVSSVATQQAGPPSRVEPAECPVSEPDGRDISGEALMAAGVPRHKLLYGSDLLATTLWPDGTVVFRPNGPGTVLPDGSLQMKFLWIKEERPMTVAGRRLDGEAKPLRVQLAPGYEHKRFQPSNLIFPTPGCWEITARVRRFALVLVTRVRSDY